MTPEEISKLANQEKYKARLEKKKPKRKEFNPFDWMEFNKTRKWIRANLALGDKFYSYIAFIIMLCVVFGYIYLDNLDETEWEFYTILSLVSVLVLSIIIGFTYGFIKSKKKKHL